MTPEQRLDKYYQKKFGWTLAEVDAMFAGQNNVCAGCHRPPGVYRLAVDHAHAYDKVKIVVHKLNDGRWAAKAENFALGLLIEYYGPNKAIIREEVRRAVMHRSVRQGLCLRCNKGLQMFEDFEGTTQMSAAERLENLAASLRRFATKS